MTCTCESYNRYTCPECRNRIKRQAELVSDIESIKTLRLQLQTAIEALKKVAVDSHTGTMVVSTFHEALNYLRSINGCATTALDQIEKMGGGE